MSTSHLHIHAQVITLNFLYCSQWALLSSTEIETKFFFFFLPAQKGGHVLVEGRLAGGGRIGCRKHFCTSFFYFLLLLLFSQWGSEKWCGCIGGAALAIARVVMPITFSGLQEVQWPLYFCLASGIKECFITFMFGFLFFFFREFELSETKFSWFCPCCKKLFEFVCPHHFYI